MTKRGERTRAKLIEAAVEVVAEMGYARASTRAIADAAGVAEGALYRHFPDKASLFFAAALAASPTVVEWVEALPGRAGSHTVKRGRQVCSVQPVPSLWVPPGGRQGERTSA